MNPNELHTKALAEWWATLDDNRGVRAQLRRCDNPNTICFQPVYHSLKQRLKITNDQRLPHVIGILAHVKNNLPGEFAQQLATKKNDNQAKLSGLRFRRLLAITDPEEFYVTMIRVLRLLDGQANIETLANDIYFWGDKVRKKWATKYYENAPDEK